MRLFIIAILLLSFNVTIQGAEKVSLDNFIQQELQNNLKTLEEAESLGQNKTESKWRMSRIRFTNHIHYQCFTNIYGFLFFIHA